MNIHIHADAQNTKNILTLIEEQDFHFPVTATVPIAVMVRGIPLTAP